MATREAADMGTQKDELKTNFTR